jgi:ATP-dependent protease HslVU (ClpYQ) peptidase subunit
MTCIVGLVHRGSVYVGGDSASVQGWTSRITRLPKVFRRGPFLIGYTTSFRMGQLLQHHLEVRTQRDDEDDTEYMVTEVAERVRLLLKERGLAKVEANAESGGQFLVGYRGRLFSVQQDFQVNEMADGYDAVGSGAEYALGALRALDRSPPLGRLRKALEISAHFNMGVSGPFFVKVLRGRPGR